MSAPDGFTRIFDKQFIKDTLSEAVEIVEEIAPNVDLRTPVLQAAIAMVGQMRQETAGGLTIPEMRFDSRKIQ